MDSNQPEVILIFAANPITLPRLRLDQEVQEIQNGLRNSRKKFDVKQQWATRPQDLRRALLDYKPAYVHFCGHGDGDNGIVLEEHIVAGEALAGLFALFSDSIKCVVLNACYSAVQARAISLQVDFVVGMNKEIGDRAAIEFAVAFYDALGAGESIAFAFALGCNAIQIAGIPEHLTPELLIRNAHVSTEKNSVSLGSTLHSSQDWGGAPSVAFLYGREAEAELLRSWIIDDLCRLILVTGLGGIGKTDLVTCIGRGGNRAEGTSYTLAHGIQSHFDCVVWRSLLNAPAPDELFSDVLAVISGHSSIRRSLPNQQIGEIIACLQSRRCLLIFDNLEAVLMPGDPSMRYREGYDGYGVFFEQIAKVNSQSCLVLTSREKPKVVADLEGIRKPVRSIALGGIGKNESRDLFSQIGTFYGTDEDWNNIVQLYRGNPLALELAARHIDQVFEGDLAAFLNDGHPVFSDLRDLLDWHLERLSHEETEIVYWLAIEREPVSIAMLFEDIVSPTSRERIASTLQSLQRRMPLERARGQYFALQPVLIEHITSRLVNQIGDGFTINQPEIFARVTERMVGAVRSELEGGNLRLLNAYALVKATASENVRESQKRLILSPVIEYLSLFRDRHDLGNYFMLLLDQSRQERVVGPGYVAGNIINLLSFLRFNFQDADFSHLHIRQACLHELNLSNADFSFADFRQSTFKHAFGTIFSLCYSPDGKLIAVGDDNGEVRLFHAATGDFVMRCAGHCDIVSAVTFSPDGRSIISASFDNTIRFWAAEGGHCTNVLVGHRSWIYALAFSPDGTTLASAGEDGTVRLWDFRTGACLNSISETGFVAALAFSPDGRMLAFGGSSKAVKVIFTDNWGSHKVLIVHEGRIRALAFSSAGLLAGGGEDGNISLVRPGEEASPIFLRGHSGSVRSLSFSSLGDILASASDDHHVRLWSIASKDCVGSLTVATNSRIWTVSFSPSGRTLATGSEDSAVRIWDSETCACLMTLRGYSNKTWALAFAPNSELLISGSEDQMARVWDISAATIRHTLRGHSSRIWAVSCSPDGRWISSASDDLSVRIWDSSSGICTHILHGHDDWIRALDFHTDSSRLASAGEDGKILIWDIGTGEKVLEIDSQMERIFTAVFCEYKNTDCIACGGSGDGVHIFSVRDGSLVASLGNHSGWITVLLNPGNGRIVSGSEDGTISSWDFRHSICASTLNVGQKVRCGAIAQKNQLVLSGSDDGCIRLWNLVTENCEAEVRGHQGPILALALSHDDEILASTGDDGAIRIWRLSELRILPVPLTLRPPRPYEGMNITGSTGLTLAQREALGALGAISLPST